MELDGVETIRLNGFLVCFYFSIASRNSARKTGLQYSVRSCSVSSLIPSFRRVSWSCAYTTTKWGVFLYLTVMQVVLSSMFVMRPYSDFLGKVLIFGTWDSSLLFLVSIHLCFFFLREKQETFRCV